MLFPSWLKAVPGADGPKPVPSWTVLRRTVGLRIELEATTVNRFNVRQTSKLGLLAIPGAVVAALPILACALCWPAYAALISSLGLGFLGSSTYLLPLTGVLLV